MAYSSRQDGERLSEVERKKNVQGKKGANGGYREEMLAVMEKEVMAVSLLSRELSPTLPQVSQQENVGVNQKRTHV